MGCPRYHFAKEGCPVNNKWDVPAILLPRKGRRIDWSLGLGRSQLLIFLSGGCPIDWDWEALAINFPKQGRPINNNGDVPATNLPYRGCPNHHFAEEGMSH